MADGWGSNDAWGASSGGDTWGAGATSQPSGFGDEGEKKKKGCFKCGEEGHMSRECPNPGQERPKRGCFNCGEEGHSKADCPNPAKERGGNKGCFKCGEEGHSKADCPQAGDGGGSNSCFKCKSTEHMAKDCELPDKCRNCQQEGHMTKECPNPEKCRRCGEEGHKVAECTQEEKTRVIENEDGTKREIYIPTILEDDKLFDQGIASGINFAKYDKIQVKLTGENGPKPLKSFEDANLRQLIMDNLKKSGYSTPTPVQKYAIPCIRAKRDLMACAQTGSGKTAAFLLPIIHTLLEEGCEPTPGESPQRVHAVIVAPTRELVIQINDEARKFSCGSMIKSINIYGGTSTGFQLSNLFKGCNILVATPGRLMDFVDKGKISFESVKYLVLDEADRMLDMGFMPEITRITSSGNMPAKTERQTLMFSATFPEQVQVLAFDLLNTNYLFLTIGVVGGACDDVEQKVYEVDKFAKREKLMEIVNNVGTDRTMVFVETKKNADFLATYLCGEGLPTTSIHGDRLQREREEALRDFKTGKMPIIVATGVASRGLDIRDVKHVINYDLPKEIEEYVHRIGRTGRLGNTGKATSFFDPSRAEDQGLAQFLTKILSDANQEVPDFLAGGGMSGGASFGGFGGKDIRAGANNNVAEDEDWG